MLQGTESHHLVELAGQPPQFRRHMLDPLPGLLRSRGRQVRHDAGGEGFQRNFAQGERIWGQGGIGLVDPDLEIDKAERQVLPQSEADSGDDTLARIDRYIAGSGLVDSRVSNLVVAIIVLAFICLFRLVQSPSLERASPTGERALAN
jgi:hypothetical protein